MTVVSLALVELAWALGSGLLTVAAAAAARTWARHDPTPMPYAMRWILFAPRPYQSPRRLKAILALRGGERLLEIGPGTGAHARPIAASLVIPLAELLRRAGKAGFSFERKTGLPLAYLARFGQVNR